VDDWNLNGYVLHNGIVKLITYQVGGASSQRLPNWRWIETDLAFDVCKSYGPKGVELKFAEPGVAFGQL
jgi:hypothetical protein